ncbi:MAG TPA: ABC transporter permease, partial [Ferruginibacter sp.]|nr:ABC transporter permease [Ferruginibacter sp.]
MIQSYFKIAWRNLKKNKVFSFINIFGLSVGLTCCILITLYINHELSYDKHHKNADDIYQVGTVFIKEGTEDKKPNTPALMAEMMKAEFPEITGTARLIGLFAEDKTLLQYTENAGEPKSFYESGGYLADPAFFKLFSYDFIEGQATTSLVNPNSVVLSDEVAKKIFGDKPALNKLLRISSSTNGDHDFTVTGVFKTSNKPSHIDGTFFISVKGGGMEVYIRENCRELASNNMFLTYLMLKPGSDAKNLEAKFPAFMERHAGKDLRAMGFNKKQFLVQLKDIHLRSGMDKSVTASGSLTYLYILGSIALFILLIGCINFMNLSTARSSKRSAEVGIRKVLGAEKNALIRQFLGESILISGIAFVFALLLARLFLPAFNAVSGKDISLSLSQNWLLILSFLLLAIFTGLVAGSYPA